MSRSIENVSKTKKLTLGGSNNSRHNRKLYNKLSDSSSISSNRNSSEDDIRVEKIGSCEEEQEQITKKLQAQVKELRHKLRILEDSIDSKDYSLGTISREKDRAIGEIRRLERCNKLLRQQLNDERNHYWEEKEKFCEEMTKYKKKLQDAKSETDGRKTRQPLINQSLMRQLSKQQGDFLDEKITKDMKKTKSQNLDPKKRKSSPSTNFSFSDLQRKHSSLESLPFCGGDDILLQVAALRTENARLRSIISERDEQNYELCLRFLRMKHSKNDIRDRFQDLENKYLQVIANLMDKIDEARQEFNFIIDQKFKRPMHSTNAMYLQMVQKNSRAAFENASLRLENQNLKKELNKYIGATKEFDSTIKRRNEPRETNDILEEKSEESHKNENLRSTKKNVNFNEVRTIYERYQTYRNSDTDSNYMTSTTVPSNGSLRDPKSTESIPEETIEERKTPPNTFPNEILKKIFQRIDSSTHSIDTSRTKVSTPKQPAVIEKINPEKDFKEPKTILPSSEEGKKEKPKKDNYFWLGRTPRKKEQQQSQQPLLKYPFKTRVQGEWNFQKDFFGNSLDFPLRKFTLAGKTTRKKNKDNQKQELPQPSVRVETFDSCGLKEKFSDLEEDGNQKNVETKNSTIEESERGIVRVELVESDEDVQRVKSILPAVRSRSSNKLNLQEELMEAKNRQITPDLWRKEIKINKTESKTSRKTSKSDKESVSKNLQCDLSSAQETARILTERQTPQQKTETSKRFSHRLCTTSPKELEHILMDPLLGSLKMSPAIVGHAVTEITPVLKHEESNDILMQLILPPKSSDQSTTFSQKADTWVEKEQSFDDISTSCPKKSSNQMDVCGSDVQIPLSSLPTSNSTMEIIETAVFEQGNMTRTLSAPGLLESSWLDPYTICEMRDCSTNT